MPTSNKTLTPEHIRTLPKEKCIVIIHNNAYQLGDFLSKHPGGSTLLGNSAGRNITATFVSTHFDDRAQCLLKSDSFRKQYFFAKVKPDPRFNYNFDDPLYRGLKSRVSKHLKARRQKHSDAHASYSQLIFFFTLFGGCYSMFYQFGGFIPSILLGIAIGLLIMNISHPASHGSFFPNNKFLCNLACFSMDYIGGQSSYIWHRDHDLGHHQETGSRHDTEKDNLPALRMHPDQSHTFLTKIQQYTIWPLICLHQPLTSLMDFKLFFQEWRRGHATLFDATCYIFCKIVHYGSLWVLPSMKFEHGWQYSLTAFLTGSLYVSLCVVANHANEACELYNEPNGRSWAKTQILCTSNLRAKNYLFSLFTGGLNLQIEHHLFPRLDRIQLRAIQRIVEQECERHGIPYKNYKGLGTLGKSFFKRMIDFTNTKRGEAVPVLALPPAPKGF